MVDIQQIALRASLQHDVLAETGEDEKRRVKLWDLAEDAERAMQSHNPMRETSIIARAGSLGIA